MLAIHRARHNSGSRHFVITPVTIVCAISVTLIASLFSSRKLDTALHGLSAFAGAYVMAPSITVSPPLYFRDYDAAAFLDYDLAIVCGMLGGLTVSLLIRALHEKVHNVCMILASFLTSGIICLLYFVVYDLSYSL
ncbi:hypothetical protein C5Y96_26220 [Blastopirellula marina]|uniref:Uncharacterized protein n=1 Tax=Blastopirellula marina TaxID=124 RepID=A0A2S8EYM1_9BACT|nr:hypothetical protein C5Y96_26220 [Blastopirellula marina]RCS40855.1 hypothetical protein DTL36_26270 [Bremerella cremea]